MGKQNDNPDRIGVVTGLVRSAFLVNAVYAESARAYDLTPQQGQLLCVLMVRPYCMGELGAVLGLAKSSLSGLVDRSERHGLVRREPDPADLRVIQVELTPKGSWLAKKFYTHTCQRIEQLPAGLAAAERDQLAALLGRVICDNEVPVVFLEADEKAPERRKR